MARPTVIVSLLVALAATGCAQATTESGGQPATGSDSAGPAAIAPPTTPATAAPIPTPTRSPRCGDATITVVQGTTPAPLCLRVGARLIILSQPSQLQPWSKLASSYTVVLDCRSDQHSDGSVTGVCTAREPGSVVVSTTTAPSAGDPHGPPQYLWQVTVTIAATLPPAP
jgi:hypothetical protein